LHSGVFGGAVANPATELARLLAKLHDPEGRVLIPGFYDAVAPVSPTELESWRQLPSDNAEWLRASGSPALAGESGYSSRERTWSRPTAEINGLTAGYQGPGTKTIVPREASAKISFRLVPDQDPRDIAHKVSAYFHALASRAVKIEVIYDHGGDPYYAAPDTPLSRAAQAALKTVFGRPPALVREGLSIPTVSLFRSILGRDTLLVGLGLPDCGAHSPNECFPLRHLEQGIVLHQALLNEISATA
jgi:acetylornithine deacetylase/succinyl-diaminopimelate desuccinylase-like protein